MTYRVVVQELAERDLEQAYLGVAKHAPQTVALWYNRLRASVLSLSHSPDRHSLAAENRKVNFELRQMLFGKRPNVFRILFTIEGDSVRVLRVRRGVLVGR